MSRQTLTRREMLRLGTLAAAGAALAACQPQVVTTVVEKEVTKLVEKEVTSRR